MSKRSDTIRSLFLSSTDIPLSADNNATARVASGPVRSMRESFSGIERENELLREKMASGSLVLDLDPNLIDPSPLSDRFVDTDGTSFEALKTSIGQRGQEVPVLVRPHPDVPGRYQTAYGHRRIRATRELGRPVRAIVRTMSDQDLVVAQGVENSARQDLSFIERAIFAMRLEDVGHSRTVIQEALSIDRAEASKLLAVARGIPSDVVTTIGRAPRAGRGRWLALARALKQPGSLKQLRVAISRKSFEALDSDRRFTVALEAASGAPAPLEKTVREIASKDGRPLAHLEQARGVVRLTFSEAEFGEFAAHLAERLPEILETFRKKGSRR